MTLDYLGVRIGEINTEEVVGGHDYIFVLNRQACVDSIRHFVVRELMTGLSYKNPASRELACVIHAAFAHPQLRFVQRSSTDPLWFLAACDRISVCTLTKGSPFSRTP